MADLFFDNRKAYFKYEVKEDYLAGMVLTGIQIKAIRAGKLNISESFCRIINGEMFLFNINIDGAVYNDIKLLLNRKELNKIEESVKLNNYSVVPLNLTVKRMAKMKIGICKGKKMADKRETIKKRDIERSSKQI